MQELDRRIAGLKLRLAEIDAREQQLTTLRRQYEGQLDRAIEYASRPEHPLEAALGVMADLEAKIADIDLARRHLEAVRGRAADELGTLQLTRAVDDAKTQLAELVSRRNALSRPGEGTAEDASPSTEAADLDAEIGRLRRLIDDASDEAARRIASRRRPHR